MDIDTVTDIDINIGLDMDIDNDDNKQQSARSCVFSLEKALKCGPCFLIWSVGGMC